MELAKSFDFELWGEPDVRRQLERMVCAAAAFITAIKSGARPHWLSFLGTSGAGKTHLARQLWHRIKRLPAYDSSVDPNTGEIAYAGQWLFWPDLAGELLGNGGYGLLAELKRDKFVVLDEIGADRDPSGHVRDCLARLLSGRVGKWTILTSNKSLGEIQLDIDTRISSRMLRDGSLVVDVDIPDYNLRTRNP